MKILVLKKGNLSLKSAGSVISNWVFLAPSGNVMKIFYPLICFVERMSAELVIHQVFCS
eukprot:UN24872